MNGPSSHDPQQPSVNRRWLWALRVPTMLFLFLSLALTLLCLRVSPGGPLAFLGSIISLVSFVLYAVVIWGLRPAPPRKLALVLAIGLGSFWFVPFAAVAVIGTTKLFARVLSNADFLLLGLMWVLTLVQGAYAGAALKVRRSMASGRGDLLKLVGAVGVGLLSGVLLTVAIPIALQSEIHSDTAPAVGSLRTLQSAEITYASTYGGSYTSSLAELGLPARGMQPSASAAGLIDSALARGTKHGYRFDYQPGPRDEHGGINSYTICARPIDRGDHRNSYFADETGVIRVTDEDRCPTVKDLTIYGR